MPQALQNEVSFIAKYIIPLLPERNGHSQYYDPKIHWKADFSHNQDHKISGSCYGKEHDDCL